MRKAKKIGALSILLAMGLMTACGNEKAASTSEGSKGSTHPFTIAYSGGTCEAPLYVAYEKGFFKDEGLDVNLVKMDFEQLKSGISSDKVDATVGNFAWFKPIEQGLGVKLTAGVHAGCIQAVTPKSSGIASIKDLKGKTIGVDTIGGGPMITMSIELQKHGINPKKDVSWKAYPPPQLASAADKKEIDAFIVWDPHGQKALDGNQYNRLLNIAHDEPYHSGYCCYSVVSAKLVEQDPKKAAAFTRAILRGAEWVGEHPQETAQLEVDKKYVGADVELNAKLLKDYTWKPSVKRAEESVKFFIHEQKSQGILEASTDENELFTKIFAEVIPDYKGN